MTTYYIIVEKTPGNANGDEFFTYTCENEQQAWVYARDKWRQYGAGSRIKSVTELRPLP